MINLQGDKLIFLISQPRAGSTLTQRILGIHPNVYTVAEPWIMLPPFYTRKAGGYKAEYNATWAQRAEQSFLDSLHDSEEAYFEGVRRMYAYLYNCALTSSGKSYFLDKTPRYYYIISELCCTFPQARFIILLRNPLSVLGSIINICKKEGWLKFHLYKNDLIRAPNLLLKGIEFLGERGIVIYYEQLLIDPEKEIRRVCNHVGLEWVPYMLNYGTTDSPKWSFGDQDTIYQKTSPDSENLEKWKLRLKVPQIWRLTNDYLQLLGPELFNQLGYSYEQASELLNKYRPHRFDLWRTFPLKWFLANADDYGKRSYKYYIAKIITYLQQRKWGDVL